MLKIQKFRHIAIVVKNFEEMLRFYSEVLGFEIIKNFEIEKNDFRNGIGKGKVKIAHLAIPGGVEIELFEYSEKQKNDESSWENVQGFRHIALFVEDLEKSYQYLKKIGIEFYGEPVVLEETVTSTCFKFAYFKDPEGNIIELNQTILNDQGEHVVFYGN